MYLFRNAAKGPTKKDSTHRALIGTPLILALLFSFAFVLWQPGGSGQVRPTAASQSVQVAGASTASQAAQTELAAIPVASTSLPTVDQVAVPAPGNDTSNGVTQANTNNASSVTGIASPSASSGLQAAGKGQSISPSQSINTKKSTPTTILTNLLRL